MKHILIPEEMIVDFLNLLDEDDEPITLQFHVERGNWYKVGLRGVLCEEGFLDSVFEIKGVQYATDVE